MVKGMIRYVLDSDHLSLHQRGHEPLRGRLLTIPPEQIGITVISVEELMRGRLAQVRRATKPDDRVRAYYWLSKTLDFLCSFMVLKYGTLAEAHFQTFLERKMRIGIQDLKIAAIALSQDATLVTRNRRDFARIPTLKIEDWSVQE
jgi:tRNA(fMet)-specific endonuclease VapC